MNEHIRFAQQAFEHLETAVGSYVERHALLIAVEIQKRAALLGMRLAAGEGAEVPVRITGRRLDLDHLRTEVGHEFRGVSSGARTVVFDDCKSVEGAFGHGSHMILASLRTGKRDGTGQARSEERRVGKEWRDRWAEEHHKK